MVPVAKLLCYLAPPFVRLDIRTGSTSRWTLWDQQSKGNSCQGQATVHGGSQLGQSATAANSPLCFPIPLPHRTFICGIVCGVVSVMRDAASSSPTEPLV